MSEIISTETRVAAETLWKLLGSPAWKLQQIADELAAAEERGRRSAETERDELLRKLLAWADSTPVKAVTVSAWIHGVKFKPEDVAVWDEARAAIAPRDSGKVKP